MMNRLHHVWVQLACCFTITAVVAAAAAAAWTATITNAYHISYIPYVRTFRAATISIRATKATETLSIIHHNVDDDLPDDGSNNDTDTHRVPVLQSKAPKGKPKTTPATTTTTPTHWIVDSDQVIFQKRSIPQVATTLPSNTTSEPGGIQHHNVTVVAVPTVFHCTIRGNPLPLRRHRTRRGFMYNPSAATQLTFRQLVQRQIMDHVVVRMDNVDDDGTTSNDEMGGITIPLWNIDQPIAVSIVFRMKRPNSHFIGNKPFVERTTNATKRKKATSSTTANSSRLRPTAPKVMCTTSMRTDIDNLAKFVLDSLNNVTYADDKQIVSLHVMKLFDNDVTNRYQGSTTITIRLLQDDDMTTHIMEQERNFLFLSNATESINTRNNNNNMF